ncbi:MAG: pitrilysin family protein, partial [Oscillospiraceae bacterium]
KETVEKEQGIIGQEIRMYDDNAGWRVFFNMLIGMYHSHPVKIDIAGTTDSIAKIDADLLYKCYNTFYNLNNMVLSIAGNVDVDEVLRICDELLKPCENKKLQTAFDDEPLTVIKKEVTLNLEVATPLFNIGFKSKPLSGIDRLKAEVETNIVLALLADESSNLYKEMYEAGLTNSTFATEVFDGDGYFAEVFSGESRNPREVLARIISEIEKSKVDGLDKERFEIIKKSYYGSQIREFNNVEAVATLMINSQMDGVKPFDIVETIASVTYDDVMKRLFDRFNTENVTISIINPVE